MGMKSIIDLRKINLRRLIRERYADSHKSFWTATGISMSQVGQWLADEGDPNGRNMSERSARKIECTVRPRLPDLWMDQDHDAESEHAKPAVSHGVPWPFTRISARKIAKLSHDDLMTLEGAFIHAALMMNIDVVVRREYGDEAAEEE